MNTRPHIDIVVRTLADAPRSRLLFRALDSIQGQAGITAQPLVVVNGDRADPQVLAALRSRPGVRLHFEKDASLRVARAAGRRLVAAAYFGFLDDDDELLENSLREPLTWLAAHPDDDGVVSSGYVEQADGALTALSKFDRIARDQSPALTLLEDNWLVPGAFVLRSDSTPAALFASEWNNMEWMHLAYRLCAEKVRLHFMDVPTVIYHYTPHSLSRGRIHQEAALALMQIMACDQQLEPEVRQAAKIKAGRLRHGLSADALRTREYAKAWAFHLASLRPPHTLRYLLYTRKLLTMGWRSPWVPRR